MGAKSQAMCVMCWQCWASLGPCWINKVSELFDDSIKECPFLWYRLKDPEVLFVPQKITGRRMPLFQAQKWDQGHETQKDLNYGMITMSFRYGTLLLLVVPIEER